MNVPWLSCLLLTAGILSASPAEGAPRTNSIPKIAAIFGIKVGEEFHNWTAGLGMTNKTLVRIGLGSG